MAAISQVPRGHHRQEAQLQETSRLRKTEDGLQDECTQSTIFTIGRLREDFEDIYTAVIQSTLEYGAVTFGMMAAAYITRLQRLSRIKECG